MREWGEEKKLNKRVTLINHRLSRLHRLLEHLYEPTKFSKSLQKCLIPNLELTASALESFTNFKNMKTLKDSFLGLESYYLITLGEMFKTCQDKQKTYRRLAGKMSTLIQLFITRYKI